MPSDQTGHNLSIERIFWLPSILLISLDIRILTTCFGMVASPQVSPSLPPSFPGAIDKKLMVSPRLLITRPPSLADDFPSGDNHPFFSRL